MLTKINTLDLPLKAPLPPLIIMLGEAPYQMRLFAKNIYTLWQTQQQDDIEKQSFHIEHSSDWQLVEQEVRSRSLFVANKLIEVVFDKKTLDAEGKRFLDNYIKQSPSHCLLIIKAPLLTYKQIQAFANHAEVQVLQLLTPNEVYTKQWMTKTILSHFKSFDPETIAIIFQSYEGNLLALAQFLEKLMLITEPGDHLEITLVNAHLVTQCDYSLYELADACLQNQPLKALLLLKQALDNKVEPTFILWILAQEIRILLQLLPFITQAAQFKQKLTALNIWSSREAIYRRSLSRFSSTLLYDLLKQCQQLDICIKTGMQHQVWQLFDCIALSLCTGKQVGHLG